MSKFVDIDPDGWQTELVMLLIDSRTMDSQPAAKSAESPPRCRPRPLACALTTERTPGLLAASLALLLQVSVLAEPITAGAYTGHWEGASGASGDFHLALASEADGKWKAEISFGMSGQDIKCKVTALTVEAAKIHAVYTFDLQGIVLESTIDGERAGSKLSGKYRTRVVADNSAVDEGSWDASIT